MARYEGQGPLRGKIGNLVFYVRNGKNFVRKLGRVPKEQLKKGRAFINLRKHWEEFGSHSVASTSFRGAFSKVDDFIKGLHNRFMSVCATIKQMTSGKRGQRPLLFSKMGSKLIGLEFNTCQLSSVLRSKIKSTPAKTRKSSVVEIDIKIPREVVHEPGATHFRIAHALGVVSDIEYEPALGGFVPVAHNLDGAGEVTYSEYISLKAKQARVRLKTKLSNPKIPSRALVVEAVGIRFYQKISDIYYDLKMNRAMRVVNVF